jgi:hypothetical protein
MSETAQASRQYQRMEPAHEGASSDLLEKPEGI